MFDPNNFRKGYRDVPNWLPIWPNMFRKGYQHVPKRLLKSGLKNRETISCKTLYTIISFFSLYPRITFDKPGAWRGERCIQLTTHRPYHQQHPPARYIDRSLPPIRKNAPTCSELVTKARQQTNNQLSKTKITKQYSHLTRYDDSSTGK